MARYKKRKDGRYCTSVTLGHTPDGRPRRKYLYAGSVRELDIMVRNFREGLHERKAAGVLLGDYFNTWYARHEADWAPKSRERYKGVRADIACMAGVHLDRLTRPDVLAMLSRRQAHPESYRQMLLALRALFREARLDGYMQADPTAGIRPPKRQDGGKGQGDDLITEAVLEAIGRADFDERERAFVSLLLYTGCRKSEIICLTVEDIDHQPAAQPSGGRSQQAAQLSGGQGQAGVIHITKACGYDGESPYIKATKTAAGRRDVPLLPVLRDVLEAYCAAGSAAVRGTRSGRTGLLFPAPGGGLLRRSQASRLWLACYKEICRAAGGSWHYTASKHLVWDVNPFPGLHPHSFRHHYATMLHDAGVPVKAAACILGHSSTRVTMDIYTHLDRQAAQDAGDRLAAFLEQ